MVNFCKTSLVRCFIYEVGIITGREAKGGDCFGSLVINYIHPQHGTPTKREFTQDKQWGERHYIESRISFQPYHSSCFSMNLLRERGYSVPGWHHLQVVGDCCWRLHWRRGLGRGRSQKVGRGFIGQPEMDFRSFTKTSCSWGERWEKGTVKNVNFSVDEFTYTHMKT